ncbi:MAG: DNA polymerase I [Nitrospinota bacterium]
MKRKRLYIIDGAGFYFRAFYAIRGRFNAPDGTPTNAIYGFARMCEKIVRDEKPDALLIALDSKEKTFRHEMFPEYKSHRPAMPEELAVQLPYIEKLITAYNIPVLKEPGLEADDLIGCAARLAEKKGYEVVIVSGDKDLMQLIGDGITMFDPLKDKRIGVEEVKEKFGVEPARVMDVLGLWGDASDNIPGVPGVGEVTAKKLVAQFGDIENLIENADDIKKPKLQKAVIENADKARLSRDLATIKTDLDLKIDPDSWMVQNPDQKELAALFTQLNFKTFLKELAPAKTEVKRSYKTVLTESDLNGLLSKLKAANGFALDTETTSTEPMRAKLAGLSFSTKNGDGCYIPLGHDYVGAPKQLDKNSVLKKLKPILENPQIEKYGQNIKYDYIVLAREGIETDPLTFDTMLASYLLSPEERRHNLGHLSEKYLGHEMIEYKDVAGKGAKQVSFNQVEIEPAAEYSAEDADITFRLSGILNKEIQKNGLDDLFNKLEMPLIKILARMEQNGIAIDAKLLSGYSKELDKKLKIIEKQIYIEAGEEFNIASTKQLGTILFDKLKLQKGRKTKTGVSTDQKALEALAGEHPVPELVLRYRGLAKLKSTYVDPLPEMALPETGRIHTSFNQAMAATGRLSSSSPNLQNIPVRTEEGRKIREAFIAGGNSVLISADYSQMELRILAHLSGDKLLIESFNNDEDVHERTAREIFGAFAAAETRAAAKAVNFGIIYGQTGFGLARQLGVSRGEAQSYIKSYFERYSGVKDFIENTKTEARKNGYVKTMAGRKRSLPEITSSNRNLREMAERMAVNTIVQGSEADLIKMAMIGIDYKLKKKKTVMLLQVHDELIFEAPKSEQKGVTPLIKKTMESVERLSVPLKVTVSAGRNWGELH